MKNHPPPAFVTGARARSIGPTPAGSPPPAPAIRPAGRAEIVMKEAPGEAEDEAPVPVPPPPLPPQLNSPVGGTSF